ncbi:MAG: ketoacyl-ACP synthase III [Planctomycetes bacterium]|nr:ketoacyl-ACP synthase III [Planctomycetota bacterium]
MNQKVSIVSTGSFLPGKILTNADLQKMVDTSNEWIMERTGIKERHVISNGEATSDLAVKAAQNALAQANLSPEDLDLIIVGTVTPDQLVSSTACYVQNKLGARQIAAFDVSAACTGFIYSLTVGRQFVLGGHYKNVLVAGAESLTSATNYADRNTCILFGDGAGAVILQPGDHGHEILYTSIFSDGSGSEMMSRPSGGSKMPNTVETIQNRLQYIQLRGREVFKFAVMKMVQLIKDSLSKTKLSIKDVALIIPHQVNMRILEAAAEKLEFPMDKIFINIERVGNTSAASIPIALDEAARNGMMKKGDIIILVAFGGGLTWGSAVIRW